MKKILSLLLCYVFLQTETFALRGGPSGTAGKLVVSGFYSGIMTETTGTGDIGMFLITAADAGASTGQLIIFSSSAAASASFTCSITGLSDTTKGGTGKLTAIFSGTTSTNASESISGKLAASAVKVPNSPSLRLTGTATSTTSTITTVGAAGTVGNFTTATTVTVGPVRSYTIDGWQTNGTNSLLTLGGGAGTGTGASGT